MISLPQKILIKKSVKNEMDSLLKSLDIGKKALIVHPSDIRDILSEIVESISLEKEIIEPNLEIDYVKKMSSKARKFDFLIGIGGGRAIDMAKYTAFLAKREWIAFPTILSHDGVVSNRAIIDNNGAKISVSANEPRAIVADLGIIQKAPYRYIAAGAGDLLSNISAVQDWKIADRAGNEHYQTLVAELSLLSAKGIIAHADDIRKQSKHGMEILLWGLICSGFAMNIYGSSRPCSGSEHNFSHALDSLGTNALHGEQCALGTIVSTYLQGRDWRNIKKTVERFGLPTRADKIGIEPNILVNALVKARTIRDRYTVLNEKHIDEDKAKKILKKLDII